jgi:hypothetical protein
MTMQLQNFDCEIGGLEEEGNGRPTLKMYLER